MGITLGQGVDRIKAGQSTFNQQFFGAITELPIRSFPGFLSSTERRGLILINFYYLVKKPATG